MPVDVIPVSIGCLEHVIKSLEKISEPVLTVLNEFVKDADHNRGSRIYEQIYEAMQVWSAINEKFALLVTSESACQQVCYDHLISKFKNKNYDMDE